ncbi:MAG: adenosylcobinamide-GDP ribazoletransferase [Amphritea sp.]
MKPFHPQLNLFFNALVFFTRIPAPPGVDYSTQHLTQASRYLPLIGLLVGSIGALVWLASAALLPDPLAIIFSIAATILLTGAFHEDGLADSADGFGGGWNKEQILRIMKDSRIGSYGAITLMLVLASKYSALMHIAYPASVMILAHTLSRFAAVCLISHDNYVREDETAKVKTLANHIDRKGLIIAAAPVLLTLSLMASITAWLVLVPVLLVTLGCSYYFNKRIGGYTGDCLGACQQLTELTCYLFFCLPLFIQ